MTAYRAWLGGTVRRIVWLVAWFVLRLALAEAILCFAALALVPLAVRRLIQSTGQRHRGLLRVADVMQFPAAAVLAASFAWPPGLEAQAFALPWLIVTLTLAAISSMSLVAGMSLAATYAITPVAGTAWPDIATMIRTHGVVNAFGFAACGLMAWTDRVRNSLREVDPSGAACQR